MSQLLLEVQIPVLSSFFLLLPLLLLSIYFFLLFIFGKNGQGNIYKSTAAQVSL